MRTKTYTITGINVSANGIALVQAPTVNVALTLTAGAASLSPVRFITITSSAADLSAISFTIVGTNRAGDAQTEVLVGPGAGLTVTSLSAWASVTSITPNGTNAGTLTVGWPVGGVTPWTNVSFISGHDGPPRALISLLATAGTVTGNAEVTYDEHCRLTEPQITIDDRQAMSPGPSTTSPMEARGRAVRFVMTSGAGTSAVFKVTKNGRN